MALAISSRHDYIRTSHNFLVPRAASHHHTLPSSLFELVFESLLLTCTNPDVNFENFPLFVFKSNMRQNACLSLYSTFSNLFSHTSHLPILTPQNDSPIRSLEMDLLLYVPQEDLKPRSGRSKSQKRNSSILLFRAKKAIGSENEMLE